MPEGASFRSDGSNGQANLSDKCLTILRASCSIVVGHFQRNDAASREVMMPRRLMKKAQDGDQGPVALSDRIMRAPIRIVGQ